MLATSLVVILELIKAESNSLLCNFYTILLHYLDYLDESIMVVTKRVQFSSAQVKQSLAISINNIVALALLQVDEVQHLYIL